jgi:hypothetical protein
MTPPSLKTSALESLSDEGLLKIFNTSILATRAHAGGSENDELSRLMAGRAFRSILSAVRQLAASERLSEAEASEEIIRTFRRLDELWGNYIFREGITKIRGEPPRS